MSKTTLQKTAAFAAAFVMACNGFGQTAFSGLAATVQQEQRIAAELRQNSTDPIPVIIALNSDAVLDENESPEYLETEAASAETDAVRKSQDAVIEQIREWYPELAVHYRYTTLVNAFSCSLPAKLIGKVSALPEVESITQTGKLKVKQEMADAAPLGQIPYFYSETGCTGEGQVIAVIDTEIDVTHPMFAPLADDLQKKISKSDLEAIASGIGFNTDFDTDQAYISSKVPFAIDYSEDPYSIADPNLLAYHGTHVCGIAAGNRISDEEGVAMSGVAPDAQIVFMGMESAYDIEPVLIAAIEDAVKLNVDAINMSLGIEGDPMEQSILAEAVNQAEAAGITVCIAAGNSDNGSSSFNVTNYADNPDVSWMNGFISEGTNALAVAAADNPAISDLYCFSFNGQSIPYASYFDETRMDWPEYLYSSLNPDQDYEYVYCGLGREEDFSDSMDLTGKIALIDRGEIYFSAKALNARNHGAVAALIVQSDDSEPFVMGSNDPLPIGMISKQNGDQLKNSENKIIRFTDTLTKIRRQTRVSDYTSWGIHSSMELRPDIMAVGTYVTSAAYDGQLESMSGTSMASPYMAGCAAILKQYLTESGCSLTGFELARYMRNLLMTSAVPYRNHDMFVTPRRQGAGLVQMDAAFKTKVILTGAEGESKLSLRDKLGTQFSFPLTLTNISNEDVSFTNARIELSTDDVKYDKKAGKYQICDQQTLFCSASLNSLKHIAAGETRTETVTVSLDAAQYADLKTIFTNGFFIEGYLVLEGAENSADISIPMVGFSDNFAQIPALYDNIKGLAQVNIWTSTPVNIPLCESYEIIIRALNRVDNFSSIRRRDWLETVREYFTEDELARMNQKLEAFYCSPNHDGLADIVAMYSEAQRNCFISGLQILDQDGNIVADGEHNQIVTKIPEFNWLTSTIESINEELTEGIYTARLCASIYSNPSEDEMQLLDYPLYVDQTKPDIITEEKKQNGKTTVSVTARDECALDGVIVLGKGEGHVVGKDPQYGKLPKKVSIDLAQTIMVHQGYYMDQYSPLNDDIDMDQLPMFMQYIADYSTVDNYQLQEEYMNAYDYAEFIPVSDSSKELTLEYDVTDLSDYVFFAVDRAFNVRELVPANEMVRPNSITPGVYQTDDGLYVFTEDTMRFIPSMSSFVTTYHYTISNGKLTFIGDMDDSLESGEYEVQASYDQSGTLLIKGDYDFLLGAAFHDPEKQQLKPVNIDDPEHYYAIRGWEAENRYLLPYVNSIRDKNSVAGGFDYSYLPDGVVEYIYNSYYEDGKPCPAIVITFDLKTGIGTLADGTTIDFLHDVNAKTGDANCDGFVDVSDAVMLARLLAEDYTVSISEQGKRNADADYNGALTQNDVVRILRGIARLIILD